ncbi:MAG TPA: hypothetical protein DDY22_13895 [Geobacter sp.]|nr:hypothetical protein [Geobacter sp.]
MAVLPSPPIKGEGACAACGKLTLTRLALIFSIDGWRRKSPFAKGDLGGFRGILALSQHALYGNLG